MQNFWKELHKPILGLAPMADVTDPAFREIIATYGKPDVFWTEFVAADGLYHTREVVKMKDNENPLMKDLRFGEKERPIVAQVFTNNIKNIKYVAKLILELGFDGIDINMGCPHRAIEKQGAGAALIKNPDLAVELIRAVRAVIHGHMPLSIKTRIGYNKNELETWIPLLLKEKPDALTLHARTRKDMSKVPARWEHVKRTVELRNIHSPETIIIGNGDVKSVTEAHERARESGADGVMVGRGIFGNPWFFSESVPTLKEKMSVLIEHCKLFDIYCAHKNFAVMKKHFKAYTADFKGAKELRMKLMECNSTQDVENIINSYAFDTK